MKKTLSLWVFTLLVIGSTSSFAASFSFTAIDDPFQIFPQQYTSAFGINNSGQVVGSYNSNIPSHAYLLDGGVFQDVDFPGTCPSPPGDCLNVGFGINDSGAIVGRFYDANGQAHGFVRDANGVYTQIDVAFPNGTGTEAHGIEDSGVIVGEYTDAATTAGHGFLRDAGGNITALNVPGASDTIPNGINNAGKVVGYYVVQSGPNAGVHSFFFSGGVYTPFDAPLVAQTFLHDINNLDQSAGVVVDVSGKQHGLFRDTAGTLTLIDIPGAKFTTATGINDAGQIVGFFQDSSNLIHGYIATPVGDFAPHPDPGQAPEPANVGMASAAVLIGVWLRRRQNAKG